MIDKETLLKMINDLDQGEVTNDEVANEEATTEEATVDEASTEESGTPDNTDDLSTSEQTDTEQVPTEFEAPQEKPDITVINPSDMINATLDVRLAGLTSDVEALKIAVTNLTVIVKGLESKFNVINDTVDEVQESIPTGETMNDLINQL